jgi:hypothetical protein
MALDEDEYRRTMSVDCVVWSARKAYNVVRA